MLEREARRPELLVPISVDFDVPSNGMDQVGIKIKDRFLWNMNGTSETSLFIPSLILRDPL